MKHSTRKRSSFHSRALEKTNSPSRTEISMVNTTDSRSVMCRSCDTVVAFDKSLSGTMQLCPHCDARILVPSGNASSQKFCVGCGNSIHKSANQCPKCGAWQRDSTDGTHSRVVGFLLAFFLGGLGIHKFYLGHPVAGVVYLVLFVTGPIFVFLPNIIIGVICLVESIMYLTCKDDGDFTRRYGPHGTGSD